MKAGILIFLACTLGLTAVPAYAQTRQEPVVWLTWHANTSVPPEFLGKPLASANSIVTASVSVFDNGKLVDLSSRLVRWYINGDFKKGGVGEVATSFQTGNFPAGEVSVRVELPEYPGQSGGLLKTLDIPITQPEAVIELPTVGQTINSLTITAKAQAYFFPVALKNLTYDWLINGEAPTNAENPTTLSITLSPKTPNGYAINLSLQVKNPNDGLAAATDIRSLMLNR